MLALVLGACTTVDPDFTDLALPPEPGNPPDVEGRAVDTIVANGAYREFFLSRTPAPGTIELALVWPNGEWTSLYEAAEGPPVGDYVYDAMRNSVTLLQIVPEAGDAIRAEYLILADVDPTDR